MSDFSVWKLKTGDTRIMWLEDTSIWRFGEGGADSVVFMVSFAASSPKTRILPSLESTGVPFLSGVSSSGRRDKSKSRSPSGSRVMSSVIFLPSVAWGDEASSSLSLASIQLSCSVSQGLERLFIHWFQNPLLGGWDESCRGAGISNSIVSQDTGLDN